MANGRGLRPTLLLLGIAMGLGLGLVYTWIIQPVELINTTPPLLRSDYRQDWIRLVGAAYLADGDLGRARARLEGLATEEIGVALDGLIEAYAIAGHPADQLRRLATLADVVGVRTPLVEIYLQVVEEVPPWRTSSPSPQIPPISTPTASLSWSWPTLTPTRPPSILSPPTRRPSSTASVIGTLAPVSSPRPITPTATGMSPTLTQTPTPSPTPTPPLVMRLRPVSQEEVCTADHSPRIEVIVQDEKGDQVAGVEVWLLWDEGADRAVTGLKPQYGAGYADFDVERGGRYSIGVGELGLPLLEDLQVPFCFPAEGEGPILGSWRIVLAPPIVE